MSIWSLNQRTKQKPSPWEIPIILKRQMECLKSQNIFKSGPKPYKKDSQTVKYAFVARKQKEILWFLLATVKEAADSYMLDVWKPGSIQKLRRNIRASLRVITSQNSNVKYANFLSQKSSNFNRKTCRWWPFLSQTSLTLSLRVFATNKKTKRRDAYT